MLLLDALRVVEHEQLGEARSHAAGEDESQAARTCAAGTFATGAVAVGVAVAAAVESAAVAPAAAVAFV